MSRIVTFVLAERKDIPPRDEPTLKVAGTATGAAEDATPDTYRAILIRNRRAQLVATRDNIARLQETFDRAAKRITAEVANLPDTRIGTEWHRARLRLLNEIGNVLDGLKRDYAALLDAGMLDVAQVAAAGHADTAALVNATADPRLAQTLDKTVTLSDGAAVTVQFGRLSADAVDRLATRYYADGLKLSDRLYNLDAATRKVIEDTLVEGLTSQSSARAIARKMESSLSAAGADNPRYKAMRIARTEINNAYQEATLLAATDGSGNLKPYIEGMQWSLSASHTGMDMCDGYASFDDGLGPGVYLPGDVPQEHPHGLCFVYPLLVDFPGIAGIGQKPGDVMDIPESELNRYAADGDRVAQRLLDQRATAGAGA